MSDTASLPAVHRLNDRQAKRIMFSRSPPSNRIGRVKLCKNGVLILRFIFYICAENMAALTNNDEAKNTIPPTAMMLVS